MSWLIRSAFLLALCLPVGSASAGFGRVGHTSSDSNHHSEPPRHHSPPSPPPLQPIYVPSPTPLTAYSPTPYTQYGPPADYEGGTGRSAFALHEVTPAEPAKPPSRDPANHVFGYLPNPLSAEPTRKAMALWSTEGMLAGRSGILGTRVSMEGRPLGLTLAASALFLPIEGSQAHDAVFLGQAHATCLLLASAYGRLRAEAGLHVASAPLAAFVAPGVGLSGTVRLSGVWGLELRAHGNLWPYTELDVRSGFTLSNRTIGMSLGARAVYLNDQGVLGAVNADDTDDFAAGPYLALAVLL